MLYVINSQLAYELAGIADAASTDSSRPLLGRIEVSIVGDHTLRAVATDSYMLAKREITLDTEAREGCVFPDPDDADLEPFAVSAKTWKKVLKEAAAAKQPLDAVLVDVTADGVTVVPQAGDHPEVHIKSGDPADGKFPNWQQLMGERIEKGHMTTPAFNPTLLRRLEQTLSAKPADRGSFPLRIAATKSAGTSNANVELRPWSFTSHHTAAWYRSEFEAIIMPMRVADAA